MWGGLTIGFLFCLVCVSGSILIFRQQIEEALRPAWTTRSADRPANVLTAAARNVARQWPDYKISGVSLPTRAGAPLEYTLRIDSENVLRVFADARSGEVLGTFTLPWLIWISDLHHHFLLPPDISRLGQQIVGWIGILLFVASMSGLLIWSLRAAPWALLFGTRRARPWRFTAAGLHRSIGVIGNLLLLFVTVSGIVVVFPKTTLRVLGVPSEVASPLPPRAGEMQSGPVLHAALEEYVVAARGAVPLGQVRRLTIPTLPGRAVTATVWTPGDLRPKGSTRVSFEAGSTRVHAVIRPEDSPFAKRLVQAASPLHYAQWGGTAVEILLFVAGLIPAILFVSGVMMWWSPIRVRRKTAARIAVAR